MSPPLMPGFPEIEGVEFRGWHFADLGFPGKITVACVLVSADGSSPLYRMPLDGEDWYSWPGKKRRPNWDAGVAVVTGSAL